MNKRADGRTTEMATPMVIPCPEPGPLVQLAYRELHLAVNGTAEQKEEIGHPSALARPWDPSTCFDPQLRRQVWAWLDDFVTWLNHEHTWDLAGTVPPCWPDHPHLVRELALLADQRRRATHAMSSDPLEDWHRYALPTFLDRTRMRLRSHCEEVHQPWPGRGRAAKASSSQSHLERNTRFARDLASEGPGCTARAPERSQVRGLIVMNGLRVDLETGEIAVDGQ